MAKSFYIEKFSFGYDHRRNCYKINVSLENKVGALYQDQLCRIKEKLTKSQIIKLEKEFKSEIKEERERIEWEIKDYKKRLKLLTKLENQCQTT